MKLDYPEPRDLSASINIKDVQNKNIIDIC